MTCAPETKQCRWSVRQPGCPSAWFRLHRTHRNNERDAHQLVELQDGLRVLQLEHAGPGYAANELIGLLHGNTPGFHDGEEAVDRRLREALAHFGTADVRDGLRGVAGDRLGVG
jgi:hypothetical protein